MSTFMSLSDDLSNLHDILDVYARALDGLEDDVSLKGKQIGQANSENPSLLVYYDERRAELKIMLDFIESKLEATKGRLWRKYTENHSRDLGPKDKDMYTKSDPEYMSMYQVYLCVQEMHAKFVVAVDAFVARGFSLRNITNLRVAQVENGTIN